MSIVILKWNPEVSSWSSYNHLFRLIKNNKEPDPKMNWSIYDHDKVKRGDNFFLLKVGHGINGIVDAGVILSKPYKSRDWSDEGRNNVYYSDIESRIILNHDTVPILTSEDLEAAIPDFDWYKGHSGVVLSEKQSVKFLIEWDIFIKKNRKTFIEKIDSNKIDSIYWEKKELEKARKELESELFAKYGNEEKISYCSVRMGPEDKTLYYIDPTGKLKAGDYVKVPYGQRNSIRNGIIDSAGSFTKAKIPFPVSRTKCIFEKIENPDSETVESLRQPFGEKVYKWKNFVSNLKKFEPGRCIYLHFKKNGRRFFLTIKTYPPKILVSIEGDVEADAEIYKNPDEFLNAKLFNTAKLKDLWNDLYDYSFEWDD